MQETFTPRKTPVEKAELRAQGFNQAPYRGCCGLCFIRDGMEHSWSIIRGQWIRQMPDSWRPDVKFRHVHRACLEQLLDEIEAATGQRPTLTRPQRLAPAFSGRQP